MSSNESPQVTNEVVRRKRGCAQPGQLGGTGKSILALALVDFLRREQIDAKALQVPGHDPSRRGFRPHASRGE